MCTKNQLDKIIRKIVGFSSEIFAEKFNNAIGNILATKYFIVQKIRVIQII